MSEFQSTDTQKEQGTKFLLPTGVFSVDGQELKQGDIVMYESEEQTGTRKRGKDSYPIYSMINVVGEVKYGQMNNPYLKNINLFYVDSDTTVSYDSYFYGDVPISIKARVVHPLRTNVTYTLVKKNGESGGSEL